MTGKVKVFEAGLDDDGLFGHMTTGSTVLLSCQRLHFIHVQTVVKSIMMMVIDSSNVYC